MPRPLPSPVCWRPPHQTGPRFWRLRAGIFPRSFLSIQPCELLGNKVFNTRIFLATRNTGDLSVPFRPVQWGLRTRHSRRITAPAERTVSLHVREGPCGNQSSGNYRQTLNKTVWTETRASREINQTHQDSECHGPSPVRPAIPVQPTLRRIYFRSPREPSPFRTGFRAVPRGTGLPAPHGSRLRGARINRAFEGRQYTFPFFPPFLSLYLLPFSVSDKQEFYRFLEFPPLGKFPQNAFKVLKFFGVF